jgi:hypothetical protein
MKSSQGMSQKHLVIQTDFLQQACAKALRTWLAKAAPSNKTARKLNQINFLASFSTSA